MGYQFNLGGSFDFDKTLPKEVLAVFKQMNADSELGNEWYRKNLKNNNIFEEVEWCPWRYIEDTNSLKTVEDVNFFSHNYWFIDWIEWIIESVCIPNGIKLNGSGWWRDDYNDDARCARDNGELPRNYLPEGDGTFEVNDNVLTTRGVFFGNDDWKKTKRRVNNLVKPKKSANKKPTCEAKGSFCVTGKVSMTRNEFQKLGVDRGYEFKSSVTKDLTYLVCNNPNSASSKIQNAKRLGIKVITEAEFNKILGI